MTDPLDDIDLWSESKYAVFRKLTHHANAAVLHFQYPTYPEIAVRSFLVSLLSPGGATVVESKISSMSTLSTISIEH